MLIGMSCHPGKMNASGAQFYKEQNVQSLQPQSLHRRVGGQRTA